MSEISLNNIMIESGSYLISNCSKTIKTETLIIYGEKEKKECLVNTNIFKSQLEKCVALWCKSNLHQG